VLHGLLFNQEQEQSYCICYRNVSYSESGKERFFFCLHFDDYRAIRRSYAVAVKVLVTAKLSKRNGTF